MSQKHKNYKPQKRSRLKVTTGYLTSFDVIYLEKEKVTDEEGEEITRLFATCTCGQWRSSEEATTMVKVAYEAKAHSEASDHCRLRKHNEPIPNKDISE